MPLNKGIRIALDFLVLLLYIFTFPFLLFREILEGLPSKKKR